MVYVFVIHVCMFSLLKKIIYIFYVKNKSDKPREDWVCL